MRRLLASVSVLALASLPAAADQYVLPPPIGTTAGTVASGIDPRITGAVQNTGGSIGGVAGQTVAGWNRFGVPVVQIGARGKQNSFVGIADNGLATFSATTNGSTLNVSTLLYGSLAVNQVISAQGLAAGTTITAAGTGTGGSGTYTISPTPSANITTATVMYASLPCSSGDPNSICAYPTGVTGFGITNSTGNQSFGLYGVGRADEPGTSSAAELTANNNTGLRGDYALPANSAFGTSTVATFAATMGCAAVAPATCSNAIRIVQDGGTPGQFEHGIYFSPLSVIGYGIYFDATASAGVTNPIYIKTTGAGTTQEIYSVGIYSATTPFFYSHNSTNSNFAKILQTGGFQNSGWTLDPTQITLGGVGSSQLNSGSTGAAYVATTQHGFAFGTQTFPQFAVYDIGGNIGSGVVVKGGRQSVPTSTIMASSYNGTIANLLLGGVNSGVSGFSTAAVFQSSLGIAAAGTSQSTATALAADINVISSSTSGSATGVLLRAWAGIANEVNRQEVINASANTISVYPPVSSAAIWNLNGSTAAGSNGAAVTLATGSHATFECVSATLCYEAP